DRNVTGVQTCALPIFTACDQDADCAAALEGNPLARRRGQGHTQGDTITGRGWWRSRGATGGEPSPSLASAASRRVGPCTRSAVVVAVAELYRGARSSERERYARQASRLGAERPSTSPGPSTAEHRKLRDIETVKPGPSGAPSRLWWESGRSRPY